MRGERAQMSGLRSASSTGFVSRQSGEHTELMRGLPLHLCSSPISSWHSHSLCPFALVHHTTRALPSPRTLCLAQGGLPSCF